LALAAQALLAEAHRCSQLFQRLVVVLVLATVQEDLQLVVLAVVLLLAVLVVLAAVRLVQRMKVMQEEPIKATLRAAEVAVLAVLVRTVLMAQVVQA
jgi:hypothetical protein